MAKRRLGIIGCGQLSQMLGEAANRLGYTVSYLCVDETPVVSGLGSIFYPEQLDAFLSHCDAITVERESLPDEMLRSAAKIGLAPGYEALVVLRERDTQKSMLDRLNIPTSPWSLVSSPDQLREALESLPTTYARCKRTLGGYDGGGQWRIDSNSLDLIPNDAFPIIAEAEVEIDCEYAIIIGRDVSGKTACYPMTENVMRDGILIGSYVPSGIEPSLAEQAAEYANRLVNAMDYIGVLAIEFFLTDGQLIVNEIAPRVHNTGHWTIGALGADQFTQHVGCVMGESVRESQLEGGASMINLLDNRLPAKMPDEPVRSLIQTYGKGVRKGRKLGHITLIGPDAAEVKAKAAQLITELHGV